MSSHTPTEENIKAPGALLLPGARLNIAMSSYQLKIRRSYVHYKRHGVYFPD